MQQIEERLDDEPENAEIEGKVHMFEAEFFLVSIDERQVLDPGEDESLIGCGFAGCECLRFADSVGLIRWPVVCLAADNARIEFFIRRREYSNEPELVG